MCGLFGFISKNTNVKNTSKIKNITRFLAYLNEENGDESLGIGALNGKLELLKMSDNPIKVLETTAFKNFWTNCVNTKTKILIGHTRQSTHGKVKLLNTHPFIINDIIGAHNGIISNYEDIKIDNQLETQGFTDSEVAIALLAKSNLDFSVLKELEGSVALTVADIKNPDKIYIYKDDKTTLHYCYVEKLETLFWSSTKSHLTTALFAYGLTGKVTPFKPNTLNTINTLNPNEFTSKTIKHKESSVVIVNAGYDKYNTYRYNGYVGEEGYKLEPCVLCGKLDADAFFDYDIMGWKCIKCADDSQFQDDLDVVSKAVKRYKRNYNKQERRKYYAEKNWYKKGF